jgi:uncharacterized protein YndB with AHSA1/START domain
MRALFQRRKEMNDQLILKVNRIIDVEIDTLFDIWTQPEHLMKWWGPKNITCINANVNLIEGGEYRFVNELDTGETIEIYGEYLVTEPPTLLRFTWNVENISENEIVTVKFVEMSEKTEVKVMHEGVQNNKVKDSHNLGWSGCFEKLRDYIKKNNSI